MNGPIPLARLPRRTPTASTRTGPDPGILDGLAASWRASADAEEGAIEAQRLEALNEGFGDLVAELKRRGVNGAFASRPARSGWSLVYDQDAIWRAVAGQPDLAKGLPATLDEYRARLTAPIDSKIAARGEAAGRAGGATRLAGSLAYGATDPFNVATMGVGGFASAKGVLEAGIREAKLNLGMEVLQQPSRIVERGLRGKETTAGEVATDLGAAAAGGFAFGAVGKAIEPLAEATARAAGDGMARAREAGIAGVWDYLPADVQARWKAASNITDAALPDVAEAAIGAGRMTAEQRAAATTMRRDTETTAINPFVANGAGIVAHRDNLARALGRILGDETPPAPRTRLASGTAMATGPVQPVSRATADAIFAGLVHQESGGRRGVAGPMTKYGQAHGLTQVLDSTAQAMARRIGVAWQPALMRGTSDEAAAYQLKIGRAFFDEGMARYGGDIRRALMFYHGGPNQRLWGRKTVAYADAIMARTGGRVELRPDIAPAGVAVGELDAIQADLDRLAAERAVLEAQTRDAAPDSEAWTREAEPVAAIGDADLMPARAAENMAARATVSASDAAELESLGLGPAANLTFLPRQGEPGFGIIREGDDWVSAVFRDVDGSARGVVRMPISDAAREISNEVSSYVAPAFRRKGIARRLYGDLRAAGYDIDGISGTGDLTPDGAALVTALRRGGQRAKAPEDALTFIARRGGLRDDEGHDLRGRGRLVTGAVTGQRRRAGGGGERLPRYAPGGGHLFKRDGLSIDAAGELLHEAGFMRGDRPTAAAVLDYLEAAAQQRRYRPEDEGIANDIARAADERAWLARTADELADAAQMLDDSWTLAPDELTAAQRLMAEGYSANDALIQAVQDLGEARRARESERAATIEGFDHGDDGAAARQLESMEHDLPFWLDEDGGSMMIRLSEEGDAIRAIDAMVDVDDDLAAIDAATACMTPGGGMDA